jgi:NADP-dependent 3-hydroxy acid dehydrogenase YdfG
MQDVCAILGVGPGNGAALARKYSDEGYAVALCSRNEQRLNDIAAHLDHAAVFPYDVRDTTAAERVFSRIRAQLGPVDTLIYNAGAGKFADIDNATVEDFQAAWEVNARGLFQAVQAVLPDMRAGGGGNIVVIGATASLKANAGFVPFASAKFAQRALAQSLARHLGPERIHVSYVIIDGVINLERTREWLPDKPDEFFLEADQIAESVYFLTQQPSQAWTFELDLRPFGEKW